MRALLLALAAWWGLGIAVLLLAAACVWLEDALEARRIRREIDRELPWILSGGIDVPLPPRRRRLRLRRS